MADMISHTLIGYLSKKTAGSAKGMTIFLVGCCLPDLLTHIPSKTIQIFCSVFDLAYPYTLLNGLFLFHEPLGYTLACLWIVQFFPREKEGMIFRNLLLGGSLHYFLDLFQHHIRPGYMPLFPLSTATFEIGWIGSETSLFFIPLWIVLSLVVWYKSRKKKETEHDLHHL